MSADPWLSVTFALFGAVYPEPFPLFLRCLGSDTVLSVVLTGISYHWLSYAGSGHNPGMRLFAWTEVGPPDCGEVVCPTVLLPVLCC